MLKKAKIAVLVSGGGTNLEALLRAQESGKLPHGEIALVVSSQPEAYALTRAENHGVPTVAISRKECTQELFETALFARLRQYEIDLIVLAGFLSILSGDFVRQWPGRIVNVHPSLLPAFCGRGCYGLKVHEAALARGVKVTGATVHLVNEIPDGGEILLQKTVKVLPGDTPELLQKRVMEQAEWMLLPRAAELLCRELTGRQKGTLG
ncbi:Phosphoribosylglycinamide formyltransferase [bioreactor metagenome]|uniref:phosphoribosylglycinamide formyltransferase 1 n=1 Tax=bioreactor metagenome TaxID=1076179 RepID=A0A645HZA2_9ZZZZ